jgi:hypothetical protein
MFRGLSSTIEKVIGAAEWLAAMDERNDSHPQNPQISGLIQLFPVDGIVVGASRVLRLYCSCYVCSHQWVRASRRAQPWVGEVRALEHQGIEGSVTTDNRQQATVIRYHKASPIEIADPMEAWGLE